MRLRPRYTLGFLMIAVLIVGLLCWAVVIPLLTPVSLAEQQALSAYQLASLNREVAEYAVREFEQGVTPSDPTMQLLAPPSPLVTSQTSLQVRREQGLRNDVRNAQARYRIEPARPWRRLSIGRFCAGMTRSAASSEPDRGPMRDAISHSREICFATFLGGC